MQWEGNSASGEWSFAWHLWNVQGTSLVLALGNGTLERFDVEIRPEAPPVLHPAAGAALANINS